MDWKFGTTLTVNLVGLWLMWRADRNQARYMNPQSVTNALASMSRPTYLWRRYWPLSCMALMLIGTWVPYFLPKPKPQFTGTGALLYWGQGSSDTFGQPWPTPGQAPNVRVTVDGHLIDDFKDGYRVGAIAFHASGATAAEDVRELEKSSLFDIHPEPMDIRIFLSVHFMDLFTSGLRGTNYRAVLVPNGVRMEDFQTLHEAYKLGVIDIGHGGGPP